jgi:hypothetical protein
MDAVFKDVTIASGGTASTEIDLTGGYTLVGAFIPSAVTGTALGVSVAKASGGTFVPIKDGASDLSLTMAASKFVYIDPKYTWGARYAKLVSGSAEGADRTLTAVYRQLG